MFGAAIGDIIGSPYINQKIDGTDWPLISAKISKQTEISVMTLAVAEAIMHAMPVCPVEGRNICEAGKIQSELIFWMKKFGKTVKNIRYGKKFYAWLHVKKSFPYESAGNGAVLRVSPVSFAFDNIMDVERFAELTARVTTKTDEAVKFARVMAGMIFLARMKKDKDEIKNYFQEHAEINFSEISIEKIRPDFEFTTNSEKTISASLAAFLENENFEDTVRTAVSLGGQTTATASMSGALAEAYHGVRILTEVEAFARLHKRLKFTVEKFEQWKNN